MEEGGERESRREIGGGKEVETLNGIVYKAIKKRDNLKKNFVLKKLLKKPLMWNSWLPRDGS